MAVLMTDEDCYNMNSARYYETMSNLKCQTKGLKEDDTLNYLVQSRKFAELSKEFYNKLKIKFKDKNYDKDYMIDYYDDSDDDFSCMISTMQTSSGFFQEFVKL